MILDQIASMEPESDNWQQSLNQKLTDGFNKIVGAISGIGTSFNSYDSYQRNQGGTVAGFLAKELSLSSDRNTLLSTIDSSISLQTKELSTKLDFIGKGIDKLSNLLTSTSSSLDSLSGISDDMNSVISELRKFNISQSTEAFDAKDAPHFNSVNTGTILSAIKGTSDILSLSHEELSEFHEDTNRFLSLIYNRLNSLDTSSISETTGSLVDSLQDSGSNLADSLGKSDAKKTSKLKGLISSAISGALNFISWAKIGQYITDLHDMSNKIAVYAGQSAYGESWKTMTKILTDAREKNNGQGHLGDFSQLISTQEYFDAMDKALNAGMVALDDLAGATETLALTAKILPDVTIDMTQGYAKDLLVGYDTGAQTIRGVSMVIKDYSDNMYVASSTLQKAVDKYHNSVVGMTRDMTSYIKKMDEYIKTAAIINENGLENLGLEDTMDYFANTAVSQWSTEKITGLAALGINASEFELQAINDRDGALQTLLEAFNKKFDISSFTDGSGNVTNRDAFRHFKEAANLVGVDTQELLAAANGKFDNALNSLTSANYGTDITSQTNDSDMASAIDKFANDTLSEQVNLTAGQELSNIAESTASSEGILNSILNVLNNFGISGGIIGAVMPTLTSKFGGTLWNGARNLFSRGTDFVRNLFSRGTASAGRTASAGAASSATRNGANRLLSSSSDDIIDGTYRVIDEYGNVVEEVSGSSSKLSKFADKLKNSKIGSKLTSTFDDISSKVTSFFTKSGDDVASGASKLTASLKNTKFGSKITSFFTKSGDDVASGLSKFMAGTADDAAKLTTKALSSTALKTTTAIAGVALDAGLGVRKSEEWFGEDSNNAKVSSFIGGALGGDGSGLLGDESVGTKALNLGTGALKGAAAGAAIGSIIPVVGTAVGGAVGAAVGAVGSAIGGENIAKFVKGIGDKAKSLNEGLDNVLESSLGNFGVGIANFKNGIFEGAGNVLGGAAEAVGDVAGGLVDGLGTATSGIFTGLKEIVTLHPIKGIKSMASGLIEGAGQVVGGVFDGAVDLAEGMWNGVKSVGKGVTGFFKGLFGETEDVKEVAAAELDKANKNLTDTETTPSTTPLSPLKKEAAVYTDPMEGYIGKDLSSFNKFTYTDNEALSYDSLNKPSQNLANYDGLTDTSQIKVGYTNADALRDGNLSLDNKFAESVLGGTYGNLNDNLRITDRDTLQLVDTKSPNENFVNRTFGSPIDENMVPLSNSPRVIDNNREQLEIPEDNNDSVVEALLTLQTNLLNRLDKLVENTVGVINKQPQPVPVRSSVRDTTSSITDQDIRNYAR